MIRRKPIRIIISFVLLLTMVTLVGCGKSDLNKEEGKMALLKPEMLDDETLSAYITAYTNVPEGKEPKATIVHTQGGPIISLEDDMMNEIFSMGANPDEYVFVNVHQKQTLEPNLFNGAAITFEDAKKYDEESVKMLADVIYTLKQRHPERPVYVYGESFGALMTQSLIAHYGTELADKYGIVVGRMTMPDQFVEWFSQGSNGRFDNATDMRRVEDPTMLEKNMNRMAAGLGYLRYTELMKGMDLSKVIYAYGEKDTYVGKLTKEEVTFLLEHKASVVSVAADHSEAVEETIEEVFSFFGISK